MGGGGRRGCPYHTNNQNRNAPQKAADEEPQHRLLGPPRKGSFKNATIRCGCLTKSHESSRTAEEGCTEAREWNPIAKSAAFGVVEVGNSTDCV